MGLHSDSETSPELVHKPEHGKRPPIAVGNWVTCYPVNAGFADKLSLHVVLDGPRYEKQAGHCVDELWTCDDGRERSRYQLTPIDLVGLAAEATAAAACVLAGMRLDSRKLDALSLRARRASDLASGHSGGPGGDVREFMLEAYLAKMNERATVITATEALERAIETRRRFTQITLPILIANLHMAGALALAELVGAAKLLMLLGRGERDESQG
jgi:hypothetical protein